MLRAIWRNRLELFGHKLVTYVCRRKIEVYSYRPPWWWEGYAVGMLTCIWNWESCRVGKYDEKDGYVKI